MSDGVNVYSTAYFQNGDGRVNLLYSVGAASGECRVYSDIAVDSVGLVRVFGDRLVICETNDGRMKARIYELD